MTNRKPANKGMQRQGETRRRPPVVDLLRADGVDLAEERIGVFLRALLLN
jgi:hypothetical protein